jgi:hypothetical protein
MSSPSTARGTTPRPNLYLVGPEIREMIERFSYSPRSPYRAGFEDCTYQRVYANPYRRGTDAWRSYEAGHTDARTQQQVWL